jgi:hypothetical protein
MGEILHTLHWALRYLVLLTAPVRRHSSVGGAMPLPSRAYCLSLR